LASGVPVPLQLLPVHPDHVTHAPMAHWLSLVHQHSWLVASHVPPAGHVLAATLTAGKVGGSTQPRSSTLVPVPVQPAAPQTHLLPGQSLSLPQAQLRGEPAVQVVWPPLEHE
jgi:hypothetical protein